MTFQEFINDSPTELVARYASHGCAGGRKVALFEGVDLPDHWYQAEGQVDGNGVWEWNGEGNLRDWSGNSLHFLALRVDTVDHANQLADYLADV